MKNSNKSFNYAGFFKPAGLSKAALSLAFSSPLTQSLYVKIKNWKYLLSWLQIITGVAAICFIIYILNKVNITDPEQDPHGFVLIAVNLSVIFATANIIGGLMTRFMKNGAYIGSIISICSFVYAYYVL